jgi:hypothetical protein
MLLAHLGPRQPNRVKASLERMAANEDMATVAAEAYKHVEEDGNQ